MSVGLCEGSIGNMSLNLSKDKLVVEHMGNHSQHRQGIMSSLFATCSEAEWVLGALSAGMKHSEREANRGSDA